MLMMMTTMSVRLDVKLLCNDRVWGGKTLWLEIKKKERINEPHPDYFAMPALVLCDKFFFCLDFFIATQGGEKNESELERETNVYYDTILCSLTVAAKEKKQIWLLLNLETNSNFFVLSNIKKKYNEEENQRERNRLNVFLCKAHRLYYIGHFLLIFPWFH